MENSNLDLYYLAIMTFGKNGFFHVYACAYDMRKHSKL